MSRFEGLWGHRPNWTFSPFNPSNQSVSESREKAAGHSDSSEPDKREASDQDESNYKRVDKKFKCPTEPFLETLRLIEELF